MLVKQITSLTKHFSRPIMKLTNQSVRMKGPRDAADYCGANGETTQNLSGKRIGSGRNFVKLHLQHQVGNFGSV